MEEKKRCPTNDFLRISDGLFALAEAVNMLKALKSNPNSIDRALSQMITEIQEVNKTLRVQAGIGSKADTNRLLLALKEIANTETTLTEVLEKTSKADIYLGQQIAKLANRIKSLEEKKSA